MASLGTARSLFLTATITVALPLPSAFTAPEPQESIASIRTLATSGSRSEALGILKTRLARDPDDTDARVLYGVILSWESRYDESREQLTRVLAKNPDHGDALPALINTELWSDHAPRAVELIDRSLHHHPDDPELLILKARAFRAMGRNREAMNTLDHLLALDPKNKRALSMKQSVEDKTLKWEFSSDHFYDHFSRVGGSLRSPRHEQWVSLRRLTPHVSLTGRFERVYQFGLVSQQIELDAYPKFRRGTYAYINLGWSPDSVLYPSHRFGADIFQGLTRGFEGSAGFRRLTFSNSINIYTLALSKYHGNWLLTGRTYLTPDNLGVSRTFVASARRYWGENGDYDYWDVRYSNGASLEQIRTTQETQVLDSNGFSTEINKTIHVRWAAALKVGWDREDFQHFSGVDRLFGRVSLYFRF